MERKAVQGDLISYKYTKQYKKVVFKLGPKLERIVVITGPWPYSTVGEVFPKSDNDWEFRFIRTVEDAIREIEHGK